VTGPFTGWLLLLGTPGEALPGDVGGILPPALTFLGLAVARLETLNALQRLTQDLEVQVAERTRSLRLEKESLERRVRERTAELDIARRVALESERRLLDRERREGVHRLAAGVAHELNNPLGALLAGLAFVRECLDEIGGEEPAYPVEIEEARRAVADALQDAGRMQAVVASLYDGAIDGRRAAVRTSFTACLAEAVRLARSADPDGGLVRSSMAHDVQVGIPEGELTRWLFRLLMRMVSDDGGNVTVEIEDAVERPCVAFRAERPRPARGGAAWKDLAGEMRAAGAELDIENPENGPLVVRLRLPPAVGETRPRRGRARSAS
ncbi:MAG: hypothetical protein ACC662_08410, partial [Planctomycetota bacterium]